jgi:hypothetical protein
MLQEPNRWQFPLWLIINRTPAQGLIARASRSLAAFTLIIRRIQHHAPVAPFAIAFRTQIGFIAQRKMHHSALPRRHWRKVKWRSGPANFLGGNTRRRAQLLKSQRPLILAIERQLLVLAGRNA